MAHAPLIVGICGPSGCGKSTQAQRLSDTLTEQASARVRVIHADHYFLKPGPPPPYKDRGNMEGPETVDWSTLERDVQAAADALRDGGGVGIVIVEGFLLLTHEPLVSLMSCVVFLDAAKEACLRRRLGRDPNRSAEECTHLAAYFERYVWPSYLEHTLPVKERLLASGGGFFHVVVVDGGSDGGAATSEDVLQEIAGVVLGRL